jgi:hypothetical protein
VNDTAPLLPPRKINPFVDPSVNVPFETVIVSESAFWPAALSAIERALLFPAEKTSDPFSLTEAVVGAAMEGAPGAIVIFAEVTLASAPSVAVNV